MRNRTRVLLAAAVASGIAASAAPALASTTTATFTVNSGSLAIAAPASVALSNANLGLTAGSVTGTFGTTTVTDTRGGLGLSGWTDTVSSTDYTTTGGTITKSNASIYSGPGSIVSGLPVLVPTTVGTPVSLGSAGTLIQATSATGSNQVTFTPTLTVTVPTNAVPGDYTGTITQTVT